MLSGTPPFQPLLSEPLPNFLDKHNVEQLDWTVDEKCGATGYTFNGTWVRFSSYHGHFILGKAAALRATLLVSLIFNYVSKVTNETTRKSEFRALSDRFCNQLTTAMLQWWYEEADFVLRFEEYHQKALLEFRAAHKLCTDPMCQHKFWFCDTRELL